MNTKLFQFLRRSAWFSALVLLWNTDVPRAWGQFGATFVSATPQTPITLGQPLNITVVVRNETGEDWTEGESGASWFTELDQPSWISGATPIDLPSTATVPDGATASMVVTLYPAELPSSPGTYSVRLHTEFNFIDVLFLPMDGSPKTVTFGINTEVTNHAPVITAIGDQAVVETNLLALVVTATDPDLPQQTLTFSLGSGVPAGALITPIDSTLALFTWTPPAGHLPVTNRISVRVTDNGSPPLSATNWFNVVVLKPPRFDRIWVVSSDAVAFSWQSFPGKTYRVRFSEDLASGSWTNLGSDLLATNSLMALTNIMGPARQRFYRLLLLD